MPQSKLRVCASMAVFSAGVLSATARAEAPKADPTAEIGLTEIIVTARRVEESQQDVPVAVTTLSSEALSARNVQQVADLQFSVPNVQIKQSNTYASVPEFIIRGQRQTLFTDENVVTYVNSVPQNTRGITLYDLESVQILKGPQGTLFGKNSNGGAVVITTKKPEFDLNSKIDVDLGNYNLRRGTLVVNTPLVADKAALRFAGQIERRNGVFKNSYPGNDDADNRRNESGRITLLLKPTDTLESLTTIDGLHRYEIPTPGVIEAAPVPTSFGSFGDLLAATITQQAVAAQSALGGGTPRVDGQTLVRHGDPYHISAPTGLNRTVPSGTYNPIASTFIRVNDWGVANNTTYQLTDNVSLRNIVSYRDLRALDQGQAAGLAGLTLNVAPFLTAVGAPGLPAVFPGQVVLNNTNFTNNYKTWTEEFQVIGNMAHDKFIAGAFYSYDDHLYAVTSNFTVGPADLYQVGPRYGEDKIKTKTGALFGQITHDFGALGLDALNLTLGVRYTWDKKDYRASNFYTDGNQAAVQSFAPGDICNELNGSGATGTGVNTASQCYMYGGKTFKAPTWTVSVDYKFTPDTMVYLTNRRGFKAGSSSPSTTNHDFAMFDSERLTDFELGLKNQGSLGPVPYRFNIAAFYGKYKDIQTADILTFCANGPCNATYTDLVIFNVGSATIKGVELDAALKPMRSLEFDLGYSYQQARYGSDSIIPQAANPLNPISPTNPINFAGGQRLSGLDFPGVPQQNASLAATYRLDFVPSTFANTTVNFNYSYRTKTKSNSAIGVYKTPAYGLTNGHLAFDDLFGSPVSLAFWGSNLTNKTYPLSCADNMTNQAYASCYWGEPRTYGVTLTARL